MLRREAGVEDSILLIGQIKAKVMAQKAVNAAIKVLTDAIKMVLKAVCYITGKPHERFDVMREGSRKAALYFTHVFYSHDYLES